MCPVPGDGLKINSRFSSDDKNRAMSSKSFRSTATSPPAAFSLAYIEHTTSASGTKLWISWFRYSDSSIRSCGEYSDSITMSLCSFTSPLFRPPRWSTRSSTAVIDLDSDAPSRDSTRPPRAFTSFRSHFTLATRSEYRIPRV